MKHLLFILFIMPLLSIAQEKGIVFEHDSTWEKVKAKAKAENRHIFVDCYTTWCGPCKYMENNIFPLENVGEFFNTNFVSLKLQFDETADDSEEIKSWYAEAKRFSNDYKIVAYPTFLIFSPDGQLVHRIVGAFEAEAFIAKASEGLQPATQYVNILKRFEENPNDPTSAQKLAIAAKLNYESKVAQQATNQYIALVGPTKFLSKENIVLFSDGGKSSQSPIFNILAEHQAQADAVLRTEDLRTNDILAKILLRERVDPVLQNPNEPVDFASLKKSIETAYPYVDMREALALPRVRYFFAQQNWSVFKDAVNEYMAISADAPSPYSLNSYAEAIVKNSDDPACLTAALTWSKQAITQDKKPAFIKTYINLLYKSGDKENAIKQLEQIIEKASGTEKENHLATLDKIKKGEPTWN